MEIEMEIDEEKVKEVIKALKSLGFRIDKINFGNITKKSFFVDVAFEVKN